MPHTPTTMSDKIVGAQKYLLTELSYYLSFLAHLLLLEHTNNVLVKATQISPIKDPISVSTDTNSRSYGTA